MTLRSYENKGRTNSSDNKSTKPTSQLAAMPQEMAVTAAPLTPDQLMQLHKSVGNQAVSRLLQDRNGKGSKEHPVQRKITIKDTGEEYEKKTSNVSLAFKEQLKQQYGTQWKKGWISYLQGKIADSQEFTYNNLQELVQEIGTQFPAAPSNAPVVAERLTQAFKESDRGVVGFIWAVCQSDLKLSDDSLFTKRDLIDALHTKEGRKLIDAQWRDSSGSVRMDQTIQGQHEWILTSDIVYVIEKCKSVEEVALWFSAAEMLRTPTKNVIFDFEMGSKEQKKIKEGKAGSFAELGLLSAHAGGIYAERDDEDEKKKDESQHNVQVANYSATFHNELHALLTEYLNDQKNDLEGYLLALKNFQKKMVWDGLIQNLDSKDAQTLSPGFYTGANKKSPEIAPNMQEFMLIQQERYTRDIQIMENRSHAILSELKRVYAQVKGVKLAVDTDKLRELDDDIRFNIEAQFNELDETMSNLWPKMREDYLKNHSVEEMEQEFLTLRAEWEKQYHAYIQTKVNLLDQAHQQSKNKVTSQ